MRITLPMKELPTLPGSTFFESLRCFFIWHYLGVASPGAKAFLAAHKISNDDMMKFARWWQHVCEFRLDNTDSKRPQPPLPKGIDSAYMALRMFWLMKFFEHTAHTPIELQNGTVSKEELAAYAEAIGHDTSLYVKTRGM